ncbi:hypothetical protein, partial [Nocardia vulneris]|uniref:hypothetical protein n=1 Tax=Nocardia vulneris TaxID=1141657 RepID=UPI001AE09817
MNPTTPHTGISYFLTIEKFASAVAYTESRYRARSHSVTSRWPAVASLRATWHKFCTVPAPR